MKKYILLFLVFIAITGFQIDQDTNTILYNQDGVVITLLDEDKIACKNVNVISISIKGEKSKKTNTYYDPTSTSSGTSNNSNAIIGTWMLLNSCTNANNESIWFNFSSSGSGQSFSADCNNACPGNGVKFYFNYTSTSSTINVNWTSVDDYCGVVSDTPSPVIYTYSLSGDILTIDGLDYQKQ